MDVDTGLATGTACFVVLFAVICWAYNLYRNTRGRLLSDLQDESLA